MSSIWNQTVTEEVVVQPEREHLQMLHPTREDGTTWFGYSYSILNSIFNFMHTDLPYAYPTYNDFPDDLKLTWFILFAQKFNWKPELTSEVRGMFNLTARISYMKILEKWKKNWIYESPKQPYGCDLDRWKEFCDYWNLEKMAKSATYSSNNQNCDKDGKEFANQTLMEDTYTSIKAKKINQKIREEIENTNMKKRKKKNDIISQLSQEESASSNEVNQAETNHLVLEEKPYSKDCEINNASLTFERSEYRQLIEAEREKLIMQQRDMFELAQRQKAQMEELERGQKELDGQRKELRDMMAFIQDKMASGFPSPALPSSPPPKN